MSIFIFVQRLKNAQKLNFIHKLMLKFSQICNLLQNYTNSSKIMHTMHKKDRKCRH